jgi:hypothetical protein
MVGLRVYRVHSRSVANNSHVCQQESKPSFSIHSSTREQNKRRRKPALDKYWKEKCLHGKSKQFHVAIKLFTFSTTRDEKEDESSTSIGMYQQVVEHKMEHMNVTITIFSLLDSVITITSQFDGIGSLQPEIVISRKLAFAKLQPLTEFSLLQHIGSWDSRDRVDFQLDQVSCE